MCPMIILQFDLKIKMKNLFHKVMPYMTLPGILTPINYMTMSTVMVNHLYVGIKLDGII